MSRCHSRPLQPTPACVEAGLQSAGAPPQTPRRPFRAPRSAASGPTAADAGLATLQAGVRGHADGHVGGQNVGWP
eukprot:364983-Chlamydomonas_euryale.AAC.4